METLYVVMPAFNEAENIGKVIKQWYPVVDRIGGNSRLVIINDGSKDNTFEIMNRLKLDLPFFEPLDKPNSGHGATCLFAYKYALSKGADFVFQTDSDGQTDPNEFWTFWDMRRTYDFLIGSRQGRQDGFGRIVVTNILRMVILIIFGEDIKDANTPFRLMNATRLKHVMSLIPEKFFLSNVMVSVIAKKHKERCKWIPITFKPRQGGINSINMKRIFKIGFDAIREFKLLKEQL